jgi:hypothetical protein
MASETGTISIPRRVSEADILRPVVVVTKRKCFGTAVPTNATVEELVQRDA